MRIIVSIITFCFCMLSIFSLSAQTEKGSLLLGGNGSISLNSDKYVSNFGFNLSPRVGYFVGDRFALGAGLPFGYTAAKKYSSFNVGVSPFARYYFNPNKISPFMEAKAGFSHIASRSTESGVKSKNSNQYLTGGLGIGVACFITPTIGLESILSYNILRLDTYTQNSFNLNVGFQIYLPSTQK